ncbi:MAG: 16S rRNA (guanine(966)-N(2))-methyltransferase RsmD [Firmicutes bacterium]|jgi:RNA methyltransferase, rsmD family|nr:16S rRNA (guanine(966)-N(2))-methyltransferase RsmD [Clostridia bacterium]MBS5021781.1 16S rRNA (guanine(966)-N(2))-methyltransferase RsmD [Bacillota bacterium]
MRIIGGKYKSRVLAEFPGTDVRPTGDRVKESLFNILSLKIGGARVLDLFCGSGALGLECLSRGAKEAVFNDFSSESIRLLEKNMKALGVVKGAEGKVYTLDFSVCLDGLKGGFDLIFLDPPYRFEYGVPALEKIARRGLLNENGIAVYERDKPFEERIDGLEKYDERRYGRTYLTFFRKI